MELQEYKDLYDQHNDYFLFGNGLSISISPEFGYGSLYRVCSGEEGESELLLSDEAIKIFKDFDTTNFEWVLYALHLSERVNEKIQNENQRIRDIYDNIKDSLINAVHKVHIEHDDLTAEQLSLLNSIFRSFNKGIFTTNYDLIAYWALMHKSNGLIDLFFNNMFDVTETNPRNGNIPLYFLHGALHLYKEEGVTKKLTRKFESLLQKIERTMSDSKRPLFVSEGTSEQKLGTIKSNDYLSHCYKKLSEMSGGLTIYGQGLRKEDEHIVHAINNSNVERVAYAIYTGSKSTQTINKEKAKIEDKLKKKAITFFHYDTLFDFLKVK